MDGWGHFGPLLVVWQVKLYLTLLDSAFFSLLLISGRQISLAVLTQQSKTDDHGMCLCPPFGGISLTTFMGFNMGEKDAALLFCFLK